MNGNGNHSLVIKNLNHSFLQPDGSVKKVLFNINLEIKTGQIVAVVGPSGCGKSTLLRAILGTHPPTTGDIIVHGNEICGPSRKVGIVYQHYMLYDFLTARDNVAFGLKLDQTHIPFRLFRPFAWRKLRQQHWSQADEMLKKVGLADSANCYPRELSGGMRQRVAVAQSLIMKPHILLMDEPFGALDETTRWGLQTMLLHLYQENLEAKKAGKEPPYTILIVTHELDEALYVSDRIIGLSQYHAEGKMGATVVYDQMSPVFRPGDPKDASRFAKQKEDVRKVVFDPNSKEWAEHSEWVRLWDAPAEALPGDERI